MKAFMFICERKVSYDALRFRHVHVDIKIQRRHVKITVSFDAAENIRK